ncbi:cytochrome c [bacterium]|nr:cytochrome c [bacterium]
MQVLKSALLLVMMLSVPTVFSQESSLLIQGEKKALKLSLTELLKKAKKITISKDPVYGKKMHYLAVSMKSLLKDFSLSDEAFVEISALDGFTSVASVSRLLRHKKAESFLAIESPKDPWPTLEKKNGSAGPFYVVWVESKGADITSEEWPFQVSTIKIISALSEKYPKVYPAGSFSTSHPVRRGLKVFLQNCFPCHTMNKQGSSDMGPDLNLPYNPIEYFKERYFWKLIRNPQNLRHWPKSQMPSFSSDVLKDGEVKDLIAYLKHMSRNKR